ncbi:copper chaperone [Datura stramonium]|uniref:Copper chaperone n=1 Tax=Datura stramonium TaxID=4076 RepID=A0ABS8T9H3_DATST|nr:copper chaperone [Datura stramonium]
MRKTIRPMIPYSMGESLYTRQIGKYSHCKYWKDDEGPFNLAMAPLQLNGGDKKLFGTFSSVGDDNSSNVKGISMLARDLQSVILYDKEGKFAGVRRFHSKLPIEIDGTKIVIEDAIGSSGLDLKTDPGVPIVYAGFGALMLTTCISFISHSYGPCKTERPWLLALNHLLPRNLILSVAFKLELEQRELDVQLADMVKLGIRSRDIRNADIKPLVQNLQLLRTFVFILWLIARKTNS